MGTDALLQGINMYLQGLLADKEKQKEDKRKLDYLKNVYVQNNMLEKQYNPEKVAAQIAADKEKAAKSNLYLSQYPQLEEIAKLTNDKTISDLLFSKEILPKEREAKTKDLDKKLNEYNYWFQNIDSQRKDEENDKKLNHAIRAQQLANAKANGDLLSAKLASMKNADEARALLAQAKLASATARANGGSGGLDRLDTYQLMKLSKEITDSLAKQRNDYTGENFDKLEEVEMWRNQLNNIDNILRQRGIIPGGNSSGLGSKLLEMTQPLNDMSNKMGNLLNKQLSTPSTTAIESANKDQLAQIDKARKIEAINRNLQGNNIDEIFDQALDESWNSPYDERGIAGKIRDRMELGEQYRKAKAKETYEKLKNRDDNYYYGKQDYSGNINNSIRAKRDAVRKWLYEKLYGF